jgi:hypothetical protein
LVNFEAGALSKTDASRTYTLLLGLTHSEVEQPLAQFNHTLAQREDVFSLLQSINEACGESKLDAALLEHSFNSNWDYMQEAIEKLTKNGVPKDEEPTKPGKTSGAATRDDNSMIREILELVRAQNRPVLPRRVIDPRRDTLESSRGRLIQDVLGKMIQDRKMHATSRIVSYTPDDVILELSGTNKTIRAVVSLSDSLAGIEARISSLLDKLLVKPGSDQN